MDIILTSVYKTLICQSPTVNISVHHAMGSHYTLCFMDEETEAQGGG